MGLFLYFIFVQVSLLLPGYALVKKSRLFDDSPGVQLCLAYIFSLVVFSFFATLGYAFKVDVSITRYACWAVILSGILLFAKERYYKTLWELRFPLFCLLLMNIFSLMFISLNFNAPYKIIPDPSRQHARNYSVFDVKILNVAQTNANDNYIPYRQAQFFVNRSDPARDSFISEWGVTFFQRTPLMGAVVANYFNLLDDAPPSAYIWSVDAPDPAHTFIKFQIIAQILNGLFVLPAFFILIKLFNRKTALITSLFLVISQFFIYNAFFSWPKSLVAFFILTSWLLLIKRGSANTVLAGAVTGIAYLTHDLTSLYVGTSIVYLLCLRRFRDIGWFLLPCFVIAAPWLWLTSLKYHKTSSFIYYPFSVSGIPPVDQGGAVLHKFLKTSPLTIIYIRFKSLFYLLSPYQLFSRGGQELSSRFWALGLYSVPGALGLGLLIPAYVSIVTLFKKTWPVAVFILMPVILFVLVTGWSLPEVDSEGALHFAEAAIVIWLGLAVKWLLGTNRQLLILLAYAVNALQFVFFLFYSYLFKEAAWLHSLREVIYLIVLLVILAGCGWLIHTVASGKKNWITA